jgi:hypothetical protein
LSVRQIAIARSKGFRLFGCNVVYQLVPDLELLYGCNYRFWEHYWSRGLSKHKAEKWTVNKYAAEMFDINWIAERFQRGLSTDRDIISHGHGSGFSLVSMAYRAGAERIVLLGYDLRYAEDYDGKGRQIGSTPRHFFGEYPTHMQHWPSVQVKDGVHVELVELYRSIKEQGLVEVINCTPDSAIDCFPMVDIENM